MQKLAKLLNQFQLKRPVEFEDCEEGHEVIALPEKTIIRADNQSYDLDMPDLLGMAKLAEIDPLLTTFFTDPDNSDETTRMFQAFFTLCKPLQVAWTYKIMRQTAPTLYEKELNELVELFKKTNPESTDNRIYGTDPDAICLYTAVSENPENTIMLKLITDDKNRPDWHSYIAALEEYIHAEPDAQLYCRLPEAAHAPYAAEIATDESGFRYYKIIKIM